jgi:hypothetical protein
MAETTYDAHPCSPATGPDPHSSASKHHRHEGKGHQ